MIEILVKVLGFATVSQALRERDKAKDYSNRHNELVRQSCNTLSDYWLNGNPRDYLDSLDSDLRDCLICLLATDITNESLVDMGLIEV